MRKFYFLRHGETDWNTAGKLQGTSDISLNITGKKQAQLLAKAVKEFNLDALYTSDYLRTKYIAQLIAETGNLEINISPQLAEISFGDWEGNSYKNMTPEDKKEMEAWLNNPNSSLLPGAEPFTIFQERVWDGFRQIINTSCRNVAIITHAGVIKVIVAKILNISSEDIKKIKVSAASISLIELDDWQNLYVSLLNNTCHLKGIS